MYSTFLPGSNGSKGSKTSCQSQFYCSFTHSFQRKAVGKIGFGSKSKKELSLHLKRLDGERNEPEVVQQESMDLSAVKAKHLAFLT